MFLCKVTSLMLTMIFLPLVAGRHGLRRSLSTPNIITCSLEVIDVLYDPTLVNAESITSQEYRCVTTADQEDDGMDGASYGVQLPDYIDTEALEEQKVVGKDIVLRIMNAEKKRSNDGEQDMIILSETSVVTVLDEESVDNRRLGTISFTGTSSMLVVRIASTDSFVTVSANELSDNFFGTNGDPVTLKSQMDACSAGKKKFEPAIGANVVNGVVDVQLDTELAGAHHSSYLNLARSAAEAVIGSSLDVYDHVAYCAPQNVTSGWIAYGALGGYWTVYRNGWCGSVSAQMHEVGHNFGFRHSGEGGSEYGDGTGMMGYSVFSDSSKCFNAAKNWRAGWFEDRHATVDLQNGAWSGKLAAFVDYESTDGSFDVVVNLGSYYMQYNKVKGVNEGNPEKQDTVTVIYANPIQSQSLLVVGIGKYGPTYRIENYQDGFDAVLEACGEFTQGSVDYIQMSIFLDNGIQSTTCPDGPPSPVGYEINKNACYDKGAVDYLASTKECADRCRATSGCQTYAYRHDLWYHRCHLCSSNQPSNTVTCDGLEICSEWGNIRVEEPTPAPTPRPIPAPSASTSAPTPQPTPEPTLTLTTEPTPAPTPEPTPGATPGPTPAAHLVGYSACWDVGVVDFLPSVGDCYRECEATEGCQSYSYNHGLWYKRCHLCSDPDPRNEADCSGVEKCIEWGNINYYTPVPTSAPSEIEVRERVNFDACWNKGSMDWLVTPEDCESLCGVTEGCKSYGFNVDRTDNRCHLCSDTEPAVEKDCANGDVCGYWGLIDNDREYTMPTLPTHRTNFISCWDKGYRDFLESPEQCESHCATVEGCKSFTYFHNRANKRCDLCSWENPYQEAACEEGGICTNWGQIDENKGYTPPVQSYFVDKSACWDKGAVDFLPTFGECHNLCKETDGCQSYSYHHNVWYKRCHLCSQPSPSSEVDCAEGELCTEWGNIDHYTPFPTASPTEIQVRELVNHDACWNKGYKDWLPSAEDCESLCGVTEGCKSYGYNYARADNRCHLCSSSEPNEEEACSPGEVCSVWGLIDNDKVYSEPTIPTSRDNLEACWDVGLRDYLESEAECETLCGVTEGCKTFSYHMSRENKRCHLCSSENPYAEEECGLNEKCSHWGRIDDSKEYTAQIPSYYANMDSCWNVGYKDFLDSKDDCEAECRNTDGCKSYAYHHHWWYKRCHLCSWQGPRSPVDCAEGNLCAEWSSIVN